MPSGVPKNGINPSWFKRGHKKSASWYEKMRKRTGSNNPCWRGGSTSEGALIRSSKEYKLWREAVFERDNWTCIWCGVRSKKGERKIIHADHIKPFSLFPELRLAIDNGRTLCKECHKTTDTYCVKLSKLNKNYER